MDITPTTEQISAYMGIAETIQEELRRDALFSTGSSGIPYTTAVTGDWWLLMSRNGSSKKKKVCEQKTYPKSLVCGIAFGLTSRGKIRRPKTRIGTTFRYPIVFGRMKHGRHKRSCPGLRHNTKRTGCLPNFMNKKKTIGIKTVPVRSVKVAC